ncbi:MAG: tetratricopeptide repeat protein [Candidatus Tenebribacter burtonii]|jgi:tetratricopeptide (TPR) repeat protein|nr:tetratricopeptide repeat protein [Candidatus Tenebribacter burtonii]
MKRKNTNIKRQKLTTNFTVIALFIITLVGILIYSNTFNCEFQFDDFRNITNQNIIKDLSNFENISKWVDINFRPLAMFSFALNYKFNGLDVIGYHVVNLIIHIFTGWMMFLLTKMILTLSLKKPKWSSKEFDNIAIFTALIFIVHPIQTQSVTYVVQRMTSLAALFYTLAVYLYAKGRLSHIHSGLKSKAVNFYVVSFLSGLLALLSKQTAATFPIAMLLFELCFIRNKEEKIYKKYLIISISVFLFIFLIIVFTGNLPRETEKISRINYLITQFRVIVKYLQLLILPITQNLDYNFFLSTTFWGFKEIGCFLINLALIIIAGLSFKNHKIITFAVFWFYLTLAVESSILPISGIIYEHRLYLPMFGFSLIIVTIIWKLFAGRNKRIASIILILMISIYGLATYRRNKVWKNRYTLWSDVVRKSPNKARANYNLGNVWARADKHDLAIKYYTKAITLKPDYSSALNNLGTSWKEKGDFNKAAEFFEKALKYDPFNKRILKNLGVMYHKSNKFEKAINCYQKMLEKEPDNINVLNDVGVAWAQLGNFKKAIDTYNHILMFDPNHEDALRNLGVIYFNSGKIKRAQEYFQKVLELESDDDLIWYNLGLTWSSKRQYEKALECFEKAVSFNPDNNAAKKKVIQTQKKIERTK